MDMLQATADPNDLIRRVSDMIDAGRTGAARPLLAAARRSIPPSPGLSQLSARLAMRDGALEQARVELDEAIEISPRHPGLRKIRADLRQRMGDVEGATRDAAEAVILDRRDPNAKALLGTLMLELRRPNEAVVCLREAVAAIPANPSFREALAAAQEASGDAEAGLETLEEGIALAPSAVALRNAAILTCVRRRDFKGAIRLAEDTRVAGIADACVFGLKGHALSSLGRHEEAADAYRDALRLGPDDPYVRHLVAATGAMPGADRAPAEYLKTVFDGYSDRFENHLVSLGYRIPAVIRQIMLAHPGIAAGERIGPILDLGCGTGLVGLMIADLPIGPLTGVDISGRMLEQARVKNIYAELREADLMTALAGDPSSDKTQHWPVIVAADVLCYFGSLEDVLPAVHARLEPGGWFIFSLERLVPDLDGEVPGNGRWALLRQGRYAHAVDYVHRAAVAAGFAIRLLTPEVIRFEAGMPVDGIMMVLERVRHDG